MKALDHALAVLSDAVELWSSRNAFQHAGALAFYTLTSMAPLLILLITITGAVLGEEAARGEIASRVEGLIGPQAAGAVQDAIGRSRVSEAGFLPTVLGVAALLLASTTVFGQLQASLNQLWDVRAKPSRSGARVFLATRLASLSLVLAIGFVMLTSFAISIGLAAVIQFAEDWVPIPPVGVTVIDTGASLLIATLLFAMIFKILPDVVLRWSDMWRGAFVTALLFVAGQSLISVYLTQTASASAYAAAGSLIMVLLWVYYSSLILLFGAALTRAAVGRRGDRLVPKPTAVRVQVEIVEE